MAEIALAHAVGDSTEQAYARSDLFEKRRAMMEDWAGFLRRGAEGSLSRSNFVLTGESK